MFRKILILIIVLLILGSAYLVHFLNVGIPDHEGRVQVAGVSADVSIQRDGNGIPHIFATSEEDAYFALGYAMSQDRLFQMEFMRAAANGSLSEILGASMVKTDKFLRRIMLRPRNTLEVFQSYPREVQDMMTYFIEGINTFIKSNPDLPIEFRLLGHAPMLWTITDMMAIVKLQGWQLSYNYDSELIFRQLIDKLGLEKASELFPYYSDDALKILPTFGAGKMDVSDLVLQNDILNRILGSNGGSNNWVVAGSRSESGMPMLCSDPHLHGSSLPGPWYFAHLKAPGLNVAGGFFAGLPAALIGNNEDIAWGLTNMGPDVQDLFIEEVNPDNENQYLYQNDWVNFEMIPEEIRIKDEDAEEGFSYESFVIRKSVHGPVIKEDDQVMALAWTGHHFSGELEAFYRLNHASDWTEFTAALSHFATAPQNFVYADKQGNIGYYGAGKVPLRKSGSGLFPVPGRTGEFDWTGYIPFEDMPHLYNPETGLIATANAQPVGPDYPYPMPGEYAPEFRTRRIRDLLLENDKLGLEDMKAIQQDQKSYLAPIFLKYLLPSIHEGHADIRSALEDWDHVLDKDGFQGSIYRETLDTFLRLIFEDELGKELAEEYLDIWYIHTNRWLLMLEDNGNPWFDKIDTEERETRDDLLREAFQQALVSLESRYETEDLTAWKWGTIHNIVFHHLFESQGGLIENFFNYGPFPFGGDGETVNRGTHEFNKPYMAEMTASMRLIVDMANPQQSYMANASGQVGMPRQPHYTDLIDQWLAGEYLSMHLNRDDLAEVQELVLTPR